ncbi:uncharacterized protein LOC110683846 [Chenopodium quinoa]|uniref:uncharacterized protein LOC110683846 n=1 Tax=Chenopodium quinoa TaxID=63459 RepID=UPI000B793407|nr:uncharacterized protein LOC110683846 [Chenopodium quinoa]
MSNESTNSSNSSSNSSNSSTNHNLQNSSDDESDHRYERRRQVNRLVDRMMDEFIMSNPIEFFQMIHQVPRAPRTLVERDREDGHNRLWNDYFSDQPVYPPNLFRHIFRMRNHVFLRIMQTLEERHQFFQQRPDATGRLGATTLQKCTAAIRLLAYCGADDSVDDYLRISASLARDCLQHFVEGVVSYFNDEYLRRPNEEDLVRLLRDGER